MAERSASREPRLTFALAVASAVLLFVLFCLAFPGLPVSRAFSGAASELGRPLLMLFLSFGVAALLLIAILRRRHRPELLAVCLAFSVMLHLFSLFAFKAVVVGSRVPEVRPRAGEYRVALGLPTVQESLVSQGVRSKPVDMPVDDSRRLEAARAASRIPEPVKSVPRAPAPRPDGEVRMPGAMSVKAPAVTPPAHETREQLQKMEDRPPDVTSPALAMRGEVTRPGQTSPTGPASGAKPFAPGPADRAAMRADESPSAAARPRPGDLKHPLDHQRMEVAGVSADRKPEVAEAIQTAPLRGTIDRLDFEAKGGLASAASRPGEPVSKPTAEVGLAKEVGDTQPLPAAPVARASVSMPQPRPAPGSLSAGTPEPVAPQQKSGPDQALASRPVSADLTSPQGIGGAPEPVARARGDAAAGAGPAAAPQDLKLAQRARVGQGDPASGMAKPQAGIRERQPSAVQPLAAATAERFVSPSEQPSVSRDLALQSQVYRSESQPLGDPAPRAAMLSTEQQAARPAADRFEPSDVAAARVESGLGRADLPKTRFAARPGASRASVGVAAGTLVESSPGSLSDGRAPASGGGDALSGARAGLDPAVLPVMDVGGTAPAEARPGGGPDGGRISDSTSASVAGSMVPGRARIDMQPTGASAGGRPTVALASDVPEDRTSLAGSGAYGAAPHGASAAAAAGGEISAAEVRPSGAPSDMRITVGHAEPERASSPGGAVGSPAAGGAGGGDSLRLAKAHVGGVADAPAMPGRAAVATGGGGVAREGATLVEAGGESVGSASPGGTAQGEPIAVGPAVAGSGRDSATVPIEFAALAVARPDASSGDGSAAASSSGATGPLRVGRADAASQPVTHVAARAGDPVSLAGAGGDRAPAPMEVESSLSAGPPKAGAGAADISAAPLANAPFRSVLAVGQAPEPDSVPQKAIYQMRKPEKRRQFIRELGGTTETEDAVEQALSWLSRAQSDDGRWDLDGFKTLRECGGPGDLAGEDVGVTALALLAYLGAGYTHLDGQHKDTVRKGLNWLLSCEKEDGDIRGAGRMYGQAIAAIALCESYSLTGDQRLLLPTQRTIQFIVQAQTPNAGWRYEPRTDSDTSVTGWQILALKSAQIAEIPVPVQTLAWTREWLDKVREGEQGGLYAYKPGHAVTPVMTAEGWFCQLFMGERERTRGQAESVACVMKAPPAWDPEHRSVHLYYWYYATLSLYLSGAREFEPWNAALTRAILDGRRKAGPAAGSWDPVCQLGPRGGRIYSTATAALCLEVYYRFLPLYKQR